MVSNDCAAPHCRAEHSTDRYTNYDVVMSPAHDRQPRQPVLVNDIATLVRHALAEVCTGPVVTVVVRAVVHQTAAVPTMGVLLAGEVHRGAGRPAARRVDRAQSQLLVAETRPQFHHRLRRRRRRSGRPLRVFRPIDLQRQAAAAGNPGVGAVAHVAAVRPIHVQHGPRRRGRLGRRQGSGAARRRDESGGRGAVAADDRVAEADLLPGVDEHVERVEAPLGAVATHQLAHRVTTAHERTSDADGVRRQRSTQRRRARVRAETHRACTVYTRSPVKL